MKGEERVGVGGEGGRGRDRGGGRARERERRDVTLRLLAGFNRVIASRCQSPR